jgi:predicted NAD-dependent protein-ADP-ribosyltransferase YbiA (DUF1768 family)
LQVSATCILPYSNAAGELFTYLFFWGHTVPKDDSVGKTCFSQWYPAPFTVDGVL